MKRTLALTVVTALCAVSPFVAGAAMSSLQRPGAAAPATSYDGAQAEYILRDYEGYVSVFASDADRKPGRRTAPRRPGAAARRHHRRQSGAAFAAAGGSGVVKGLDFTRRMGYTETRTRSRLEDTPMSEAFGSDYLTIEDEEGNEFELEILNEFELDGQDYLAALPADMDEDDPDFGIILLKIMEENGEELFGSIDDDDELDKVYDYYMQEVFADEDEDSDDGAEE